VLTGSRILDAMLPLGGIALALALIHRAPLWVFVFAALGLIPLAAVLGTATRDLAARLGPLAAGLLEATCGNASELILGLVALRAGLVEVVKASLTGSIISNLLMVMGLALLLGGMGREKQKLDQVVASTNSTMLFLAAVGLVVPAVFALGTFGHLGGEHPALQSLSYWTAAVLVVIYAVSLYFQLKTNPRVGTIEPAGSPKAGRPLLAMGLTVVAIAVLSELLVGELQVAKQVFHGTDLFWGAVVFALIGNASEHGVAIAAARRDEMDLAMAIGVGSSLQIALLLAPVLVFASLLLGHPMSLVFSAIEIMAVVLSVVMVGMIAMDGETNWFEGAQLLAVYAMRVAAFYFVP
jgi:Ca2+:H+ antiporter